MTIASDFRSLNYNLKIPKEIIDKVSLRKAAVTRRINKSYWNCESEIIHSLYVGSYGRETAIDSSDIDLIVELPWSEFYRYNSYHSNGQSQLLQDVKEELKKTYPSSRIRGDGQVIVIEFTDGHIFEIVPAFKQNNNKYCYPDTHNGGSWQITDPISEIKEFNACDLQTNGNYKNLARMVRAWNKENNVDLSGISIDILCYDFLENYPLKYEPFLYYDLISRDFFKYLKERDPYLKLLITPGSGNKVLCRTYTFSKASQALEHALKAIKFDEAGNYSSARKEWREIYGSKF